MGGGRHRRPVEPPPAFRRYVDMSKDVELGISRLFAVGPDTDSDCEPVHWGFFSVMLACAP